MEEYGENRYRAPIVLTEKGKNLTRQIRKKAEHALKMAGDGLSEQMRRDMYQALEIIASNLKDMSEDKPNLD